MRKVLVISLLCLLMKAGSAQTVTSTEEPPPVPPTKEQLYRAQDNVRVKLYQYSYHKSIRMESLDDAGAVTGWREGAWALYLRMYKPPEVRRLSLTGPGLKRIGFPKGAALSDAVESLPHFFSDLCGLRLVGREGDLWKFRTWAGATAWENAPCFDGLVWTNDDGVAMRANGRREPPFMTYDDGVYRAIRSAFTMDARGFPVRIEGDDILTSPTYYERDKNGSLVPFRARVRQLILFSDYKTMHTYEPVVIEEGEPGVMP